QEGRPVPKAPSEAQPDQEGWGCLPSPPPQPTKRQQQQRPPRQHPRHRHHCQHRVLSPRGGEGIRGPIGGGVRVGMVHRFLVAIIDLLIFLQCLISRLTLHRSRTPLVFPTRGGSWERLSSTVFPPFDRSVFCVVVATDASCTQCFPEVAPRVLFERQHDFAGNAHAWIVAIVEKATAWWVYWERP
ncbi:unnamed protein product, partial [Ectocarpus fasciculatus]